MTTVAGRRRASAGAVAAPRESGAMAVMLTFVILVALVAAALVVDAGFGFVNHRRMQNAADAGALAGANVLFTSVWAPAEIDATRAATLDTAVRNVVAANGGDLSSGSRYSCEVLRPDKTVIASCDDTAGWLNRALQPSGVRVVSDITQPTFLGGVVGRSEINAAASAAASVQPLKTAIGPLLTCAGQSGSGIRPTPPDLLVGGRSAAAPYPLNPAAVGKAYAIFGPKVDPCGLGSADFKGRLDPDRAEPTTLPGTLYGEGGDAAGSLESTPIAGQTGCTNESPDPEIWTTRCVLILPICTSATKVGSELRFHCVTWGAFEIINSGPHRSKSNEWNAVFRGAAASGIGGGGTGSCAPGSVCVVKLIE